MTKQSASTTLMWLGIIGILLVAFFVGAPRQSDGTETDKGSGSTKEAPIDDRQPHIAVIVKEAGGATRSIWQVDTGTLKYDPVGLHFKENGRKVHLLCQSFQTIEIEIAHATGATETVPVSFQPPVDIPGRPGKYLFFSAESAKEMQRSCNTAYDDGWELMNVIAEPLPNHGSRYTAYCRRAKSERTSETEEPVFFDDSKGSTSTQAPAQPSLPILQPIGVANKYITFTSTVTGNIIYWATASSISTGIPGGTYYELTTEKGNKHKIFAMGGVLVNITNQPPPAGALPADNKRLE